MLRLVEVKKNVIVGLSKKSKPLLAALAKAELCNNPVFVKRMDSILVMEREQFELLQEAMEGDK